ncbi:MAG: hypothetical protein ACOYXC_17710, partial [Candidatus Rifleibacteriota bacterium]
MGDTQIRSTLAWCGACRKVEHAVVVERNGAVYMDRFCPKGVESEIVCEKYDWYIERINRPHI